MGRFERAFILHLQDSSENPAKEVQVTQEARSQCKWWIVTLDASKNGRPIPDIRHTFPAAALQLYTDAAGLPGAMEGRLNGWGSCMIVDRKAVMTFYRWPDSLATPQGTYSSKLSFLEGVAGLAGFYSVAEHIRGRAVTLFTDNRGLVFSFNKGHSSCDLTSTIILAMQRFAQAIGANISLEWVPRCSSKQTLAADYLSKGLFHLASETVGLPVVPGRYSLTLASYVEGPVVTRCLGQAMAKEISQFMETVPTGMETISEVETLVKLKKTDY